MRGATVTVKVTASPVVPRGVGGALLQADPGNTADVYIGGEDVTADTTGSGGIRLQPGVILPIVILGNETVWAVCASGAPLLRVEYSTQGATAFVLDDTLD